MTGFIFPELGSYCYYILWSMVLNGWWYLTMEMVIKMIKSYEIKLSCNLMIDGIKGTSVFS